jgi:hypothetical protein
VILSTNAYHLLQFGIIVIFCAVLLWLIWREANAGKIDINIDPNLAALDGVRDRVPAEFLRFASGEKSGVGRRRRVDLESPLYMRRASAQKA